MVTNKKHPCSDCKMCQWCSDDRCRLCLKSGSGCHKKMSIAEQIAHYEAINSQQAQKKCPVLPVRIDNETKP